MWEIEQGSLRLVADVLSPALGLKREGGLSEPRDRRPCGGGCLTRPVIFG